MNIDYKQELNEWLEFLLKTEQLEGASEGIARQILDKGYKSLSVKQQKVFKRYIQPLMEQKCECGCDLTLEDVKIGLGRCGWCKNLEYRILTD